MIWCATRRQLRPYHLEERKAIVIAAQDVEIVICEQQWVGPRSIRIEVKNMAGLEVASQKDADRDLCS